MLLSSIFWPCVAHGQTDTVKICIKLILSTWSFTMRVATVALDHEVHNCFRIHQSHIPSPKVVPLADDP